MCIRDRYKTVSDLTGKATLWLPAGDYTLSYFDVYRDDVGIIHQDDGVGFTVANDNNNTTEVKIGLDVEAQATVSDQSKVYINDHTTDAKMCIRDRDTTGTNIPLFLKNGCYPLFKHIGNIKKILSKKMNLETRILWIN